MLDTIKSMVEDKVQDIFCSMQNELCIESGDIEPLDSLKLDEAETELAKIIESVLMGQSKEVHIE